MAQDEEKQVEELEHVEDLSAMEQEMPPEQQPFPTSTASVKTTSEKLSFALCDDIAHYSGLASWAFLALFILGAVIEQSLVQSIGMFGAIATIALSMVFDELAARKIGEGRGSAGVIVLIFVMIAVAASVIGYAIGKPEAVAGGVFGLLILSFVPSVIDHFKVSKNDNDYSYRPSASGGYSEFGEIFGVHTPKPQPPITIEKGEELDDEWQEYLGIEIPDIESLRKQSGEAEPEDLDKLERNTGDEVDDSPDEEEKED